MSSRRKRRRFSRRTQPGAPPGTLVPDPSSAQSVLHVIGYGPEGFEEKTACEISVVRDFLTRFPVTWVNVDGLGDAGLIAELGEIFGLHRLALEDVLHTHQRAKAEQYGDVLFFVAQMLMPHRPGELEQVSIFTGRNFVVSFQEHLGGDCLDLLRLRIRAGFGRGKSDAPGYLTYSIIDSIIDVYFPRLEELGERLDALEDAVIARPTLELVQKIHDVRRELRVLRRAVWPLRDAIATLLRDHTPLLGEETRLYLRDCHDHAVQILDLLENYREVAAGLTELYLSSLSNSTNEVMRVLTVISTIFIPLTFVVGIYGMNFETRHPLNMPELSWPWGYPLIMLLMTGLGVGMFVHFKRRGWIGKRGNGVTGEPK
jgi:magnesium transporter